MIRVSLKFVIRFQQVIVCFFEKQLHLIKDRLDSNIKNTVLHIGRTLVIILNNSDNNGILGLKGLSSVTITNNFLFL